MTESWIKIDGFENYEFNRFGFVRKGQKILKVPKTKAGYYQVLLSKTNIKTRKYIHRLIAIYFITNTLILL